MGSEYPLHFMLKICVTRWFPASDLHEFCSMTFFMFSMEIKVDRRKTGLNTFKCNFFMRTSCIYWRINFHPCNISPVDFWKNFTWCYIYQDFHWHECNERTAWLRGFRSTSCTSTVNKNFTYIFIDTWMEANVWKTACIAVNQSMLGTMHLQFSLSSKGKYFKIAVNLTMRRVFKK